jgi:transcriptional activator of cad operon
MPPPTNSAAMRIGEWTIDAGALEMVDDAGKRIRLEARAMRVLQILHARAGSVVTSEELLNEVWGRKIVSPHSLATVIGDLRRALGDDSRTQRYIQTIPKRGYRLAATSVERPPRRSISSRSLGAGAAILAVVLAIGGGNEGAGSQTAAIESSVTARYVRARELWSRRDQESILEARRLLQEIVDRDSGYAPAYAALADIYAHKTGAELDLPELETFREAQRLVDRARALRPDMPELHVTQALLDFYRDEQPQKALRSIDEALRIDPRFAYAWQTRAMVLSALGKPRGSLDAIERAAQLDPASTSIEWDRVWFLYLARDYEQAYNAFRQTSEHSRPNYLYGALIEEARGRHQEAFWLWLSRLDQKQLSLSDRTYIEALANRGALPEADAGVRRTPAAAAGR